MEDAKAAHAHFSTLLNGKLFTDDGRLSMALMNT